MDQPRSEHSTAENADDGVEIKFTGTNIALPMVIKLQISTNTVSRVCVDPHSQVDILYWSAFVKMGLSESMLKPFEAYLVDNYGDGVPVKGYIDLDTTFGKGENAKMIKVRYFVVDSFSVYNVVIGRPSLGDLGAVISVISVAELAVEYPVGDGKVGVLRTDTNMAMVIKCFERFLKADIDIDMVIKCFEMCL